MRPPHFAIAAQMPTNSVMPMSQANAVTSHSGACARLYPVGTAALARRAAASAGAAGCAGVVGGGTTARTSLFLIGREVISGDLDLEAAGVALRVAAVPHHAVDEPGGAHRVLRQGVLLAAAASLYTSSRLTCFATAR